VTENQRRAMRDYLAVVEYHGSVTVHHGSYAAIFLDALLREGKVTASPATTPEYVTYQSSESEG
jgi:hypothetical protein